MALLSFTGSPHGGSHKLLPEWQSQPKITPTTIIDHSIVGSALGAWNFFKNNTGVESHFILAKSGVIWQLMDTSRQADANLNANSFGISIETEDNGNPNTDPWTAQQLASLKWLHNKLVAVHPTIPRKKVTSCSGGGLGYHSLCPTTSSNPWTPSAGKTCPGKPVRVDQWSKILIPAFLSETEEGIFVALTDAEQNEVLRAARQVNNAVAQGQTSYEGTIEAILGGVQGLHNALAATGTTGPNQTVDVLHARLRNIENFVAELALKESIAFEKVNTSQFT